jgi:hypothetical protein
MMKKPEAPAWLYRLALHMAALALLLHANFGRLWLVLLLFGSFALAGLLEDALCGQMRAIRSAWPWLLAKAPRPWPACC